jgi:hypothetical protein
MIRKLIVALAAVAALSTATATGAMARHPMGHPHHSIGMPHHHFAFRHHHRFHNRFAFVGVPYASDYDCFVVRRVWTPWGWSWRRIWVCGDWY